MGGLYDFLRKTPVSDEQKMLFIVGISRGMLHLHKEGVIHRDLAVRNILLSKHLEPKVNNFFFGIKVKIS
jgi:serine/threonine protein kinase